MQIPRRDRNYFMDTDKLKYLQKTRIAKIKKIMTMIFLNIASVSMKKIHQAEFQRYLVFHPIWATGDP